MNKTVSLREEFERIMSPISSDTSMRVMWDRQIDQIISSVLERIPEKKGVDELLVTMGDIYNDLAVQVAYKEGYNKAIEETIKNIKGEEEV